MAVYTVHEPPLRGAVAPPPERFIFVRDGFSFAALLFGPLWMLRHRMWVVLFGYVLVLIGLAAAVRLAQSSSAAGATAYVLLALLVGFEAGTLRRFTLRRRRFRNIGVVVGDDLEAAEARFFDSWIKRAGEIDSPRYRDAPPSATAYPTVPQSPPAGPEVLGLFPEPGART
jgi:hypothetical protein